MGIPLEKGIGIKLPYRGGLGGLEHENIHFV